VSADNPGRGKSLFPQRARANASHSELVRERIRTAMLLNRLQNFVMGRIDMQPHQVTAALGVLKKTVPDLQAIEHSGTIIEEVHTVSAEPLTEAQWQETYGGDAQRSH
jgi:hypothetical protein